MMVTNSMVQSEIYANIRNNDNSFGNWRINKQHLPITAVFFG